MQTLPTHATPQPGALEGRAARKYEATRIEWEFDVSHAGFTRAFESLLGKMEAETLRELPSLPSDVARAKLSAVVGDRDFALFQRLDHGAILASLYGRRAAAVTYVFGNALIAVEMTKHVPRAGLYVPLRLFVEEIGERRVKVSYDLPSSLIASLGSKEADAVAEGLESQARAAPGGDRPSRAYRVTPEHDADCGEA